MPLPAVLVTVTAAERKALKKRIIDSNGELVTTVPRNSPGEISRFKAHGSRHSR
jgi:hypothetical protein